MVSGCAEQSAPEAFFCPQEQCGERITLAINNAKASVDIAAYAITDEQIAKALEEAARRGAKVRVIGDKLQANSKYSKLLELEEKGVETRVSKSGLMHNKFIVIDGQLVVTGSFNYTENANTKNSENIIFVHDTKTAQRYSNEFFSLWVAS
ncbi:MAG: phospholipase D-like domain-containing protein [archaeon]|nr:phospholipase D-like domain-containing protein [archaeon]